MLGLVDYDSSEEEEEKQEGLKGEDESVRVSKPLAPSPKKEMEKVKAKLPSPFGVPPPTSSAPTKTSKLPGPFDVIRTGTPSTVSSAPPPSSVAKAKAVDPITDGSTSSPTLTVGIQSLSLHPEHIMVTELTTGHAHVTIFMYVLIEDAYKRKNGPSSSDIEEEKSYRYRGHFLLQLRG